MQASPGDRIIIKGHRIGEPDRDCEVLEVGDDGAPPYRVPGGAILATSRCSSPAPTHRSSTSTTPTAEDPFPDAHEAPVDDAAITEAFAPRRQGAYGPIRGAARTRRSS